VLIGVRCCLHLEVTDASSPPPPLAWEVSDSLTAILVLLRIAVGDVAALLAFLQEAASSELGVACL
jgi:hypothetical protein